ncbi:MAG: UDP-3-O-[3-hydroxymyristoyl] glucosamine N-acyltransferase [Thermoanaerobaculia bacterium]|jgi:UDP-3-O-[3-hydroxymyristoyl] glucosamine N-acyltransferase|nr:UDP-3-O-[3-hydroxymyristoyl] glucosamine N-acyltransferase [Thermoanaerobaculia bacterium]
MPAVPLAEIVSFVNGRHDGPDGRTVGGVAPLADADETQISFLSNPKYAAQLASTRAGAILVGNDVEGDDARFIRVANPYFAMASVVAKYFDRRPMPQGISPLASIAPTATLGANVAVGPFSTIGDNVTLADGVVIFQNVSIEAGSAIGEGTIVYPQVSIYDRSIIGKRCIIHSGVVIGADGYGFATEGGRHHKIPQIGIVRIGDDVEIGAGSTIDRAALGETVIGDGTKIDDLVMIAHNVKVGRHCLLVAQVGIAGSTELGDGVVVAGQSGIAGHLKIGNGVQVAAKSAVLDDVPDGAKVMGIPAMPFREFARREAMLRRLAKKKGSLTDTSR